MSVPVSGQHRTVRWWVAAALFACLMLAFAGTAAAHTKGHLSAAKVSTHQATATESVSFSVKYTDASGSAPKAISLDVGRASYGLTAGSHDFSSGVVYSASGTVAEGCHWVIFRATAANGAKETLGAGAICVKKPASTPKPTPTPTPKSTPTTGSGSSDPDGTHTGTGPNPTPTAPPDDGIKDGGTPATPAPTPNPTPAPTPPPADPTAPPAATPDPTDPSATPAPGTDPTAPAATPGAPDPTTPSGPADPADPTAPANDPKPTASGQHGAPIAPGAVGPKGSGPSSPAAGTPGQPAGGSDPADVANEGTGADNAALVASRFAGRGGAVVAGTRSGGGARDADGWDYSTYGRRLPIGEIFVQLAPTIGTTTTTAVVAWGAFITFGRRRRIDPPAPDEVLAAAAATGLDTGAAPGLIPTDESLMPRWRRPSLQAARRADPLRMVAEAPHLTFATAGIRPLEDAPRRVIRYRLVRLLDSPDELRSVEIGVLDQGDEVQLLERSGAYWRVLCPDGGTGWVHRMTLGDVTESPEPQVVPWPEAALMRPHLVPEPVALEGEAPTDAAPAEATPGEATPGEATPADEAPDGLLEAYLRARRQS